MPGNQLELDGPATDRAILYVILATSRAVDRGFEGFAAIGAVNKFGHELLCQASSVVVTRSGSVGRSVSP